MSTRNEAEKAGALVLKKLMVGILLTTLCNLVVLPMGWAQTTEGEGPSQATEAGLGLASGVLTLVYLPAKTAYAGLGGIIGGFTYALTGGDLETAKSVWEPSFYGTYVVTPAHLKGEEPVHFFGTSPYEYYEEEALPGE